MLLLAQLPDAAVPLLQPHGVPFLLQQLASEPVHRVARQGQVMQVPFFLHPVQS